VILLQDRFEGTIEAAPCMITGLRERGLEPGRLQVADSPSPKNGDGFIEVVPSATRTSGNAILQGGGRDADN